MILDQNFFNQNKDLYLIVFTKTNIGEKLGNYVFKYINTQENSDYFPYFEEDNMKVKATKKLKNGKINYIIKFNPIENDDISYYIKAISKKGGIKEEKMNTIAITESKGKILQINNPEYKSGEKLSFTLEDVKDDIYYIKVMSRIIIKTQKIFLLYNPAEFSEYEEEVEEKEEEIEGKEEEKEQQEISEETGEKEEEKNKDKPTTDDTSEPEKSDGQKPKPTDNTNSNTDDKTALIVGVSVGSLLLVIVIVLIIVMVIYRSRNKDVLNQVYDVYGGMTASELETITHREWPWIKARGALEPWESCTDIISENDMRSYYRKKYEDAQND